METLSWIHETRLIAVGMKDKFHRFGEIHWTYIEHQNENRTTPGKIRPVMVVSEEHGLCTVVPVTSRDTPFNRINGYRIKDWQQAGLKKECFVDCHPKDARSISLQDLNHAGRLSLRDREGTFKKLVSVAEKSLHRTRCQEQEQEYER